MGGSGMPRIMPWTAAVAVTAVAVVGLPGVSAAEGWQSNVVTLTESNFERTVKAAEVLLVEFYAPWCGHCKKLAPTWELTATALADDGITGVIGKIDATTADGLASKYGVTSYPTAKLFRGGDLEHPEDYDLDPRMKGTDEYSNYVRRQLGINPTQQARENWVDHYAVLGLTKEATDAELSKAYRRLSRAYHPDKQDGKEDKLKELQAAWETLGDPVKRKAYDTYGTQTFGHRDEYLAAVQQDGAEFKSDVGFYADTCDKDGENCLVTELNEESFWGFPQSNPEEIFLLEFYTPWCTHCQEHAKDIKNVALRLEGKVKFAAINCENYKPLCQRLQVKFYPTLNLFLAQENQEIRWPKDNTLSADGLHSWILKQTKASQVVKLTHENFYSTVMQSEDTWIVNLSAGPRCGACEGMKKTIREIADKLSGIAKVGTVICDADGGKSPTMQFCTQDHAMQAFPTVKVYHAGPKRDIDDAVILQDKYADIATPQLLPLFIEIYAEGLVEGAKAAEIAGPAVPTAVGEPGTDDSAEVAHENEEEQWREEETHDAKGANDGGSVIDMDDL